LVVEPINGRDKMVEELMGGKAVGEMDSREEDKGEGRTGGETSLVWGYFGLWKGKKMWRERRGRAGNSFCCNDFAYIFA
jgi:hypothetical protein